MNVKKILALMLCAMMLLSLAACGAKGNDKQADMSGDSSAMTGEPKNAEKALALLVSFLFLLSLSIRFG